MKVAEGLHYFERVILQANFLAAHGIKSRFIFVYSKAKNPSPEGQSQKSINDAFLQNAGIKYQRFIFDRYDKKWQYVDEAVSLDEEEFMQHKSLYV